MPAGMSRNAFIPVFVLAGPSLNYKNVFVYCIMDGPVMQHTVQQVHKKVHKKQKSGRLYGGL